MVDGKSAMRIRRWTDLSSLARGRDSPLTLVPGAPGQPSLKIENGVRTLASDPAPYVQAPWAGFSGRSAGV